MATYQKRKPAGGTTRGRKTGRKAAPASPPLRRFQKLMRRILKKTRGLDTRVFLIPVSLVLLVVFSVTLTWFLTNKNAFEVYLSETKIGILKKSDDITPETLEAEAITKLAEQLGANVDVNEKVILTPVHASSKELDSISYVVSEISKKFTYKIEAVVFTVDGIEMAIVKNLTEAEKIKENIIAQYISDDSDIIESGFVENVQTPTRFVEKTDIVTNDTAYTILTARKEIRQSYTVASGDSYWSISNMSGITQEKIFELNPELDPQKSLKIGQELALTVSSPILSVKTVEKVVLTEAEEAVKEYRNNLNERKSYSRVVQQGKDGQKEVTYHITRINGAQQERVSVEEVYITQPVPEIIEVGTR